MQDLSPNTTLSHYRIVSKIGAGGMGDVYLAHDTSELGRTVALKILSAEVAKDKDRLQRFTQEARTVSKLNHPNILTVYEFGQTDSVFFIATEYIDGTRLREYLSGRRLKLIEVLDVVIQIVAAVNAASEAGVTHRDLKPENVMVRRDHIIKVLDFGLAKLSEPTAVSGGMTSPELCEDSVTMDLVYTEPGLIMGTVRYMSPEQSAGAPVDQRTDIWSIGVVLYEMIAGVAPFSGKDKHRQIIAIQEADPTPLAQQVEGVPDRLEEIVSKCLAKDKNERYQTARDLLIDLRNLRHKLGLDAEIKRTVSPSLRNKSGGPSHDTHNTQLDKSVPATAEQLGTTSGFEYIVAGIRQRKVASIIVALMLVTAATAVGLFWHARNVTINSIAVMPFVNASGNADTDYLSDGMTEALITILSQLPNIKVKARSAVFRYKGKETDPKTVGKDLNVQALLYGRVKEHGDDLTLILELVDAQTENVIWTGTYNRKQAELVSLQSEIVRDVSGNLKLKLSGFDQQKLAKTYTGDPEVLRLYYQGRFKLNMRGSKLSDGAKGYFQQAVDKDPNFALGYVGLADIHDDDDRTRAKEYIRRALELDDQLAEAHASLGYQYMMDYNWGESERELNRAIELNPNYRLAYQYKGTRLMMLGKHDEALDSFKREVQIEPTSMEAQYYLAVELYWSGKVDESIQLINKIMIMDPTFSYSHSLLSHIYHREGDHAMSVEERAKYFELIDRQEDAKLLRESFANGGWKGYLIFLASEHGAPRPEVFAELGEKERAITMLIEKAEKGYLWLFTINTDPRYESIRGDPRIQELMKKFKQP